jgi:hypothetical protein
MAGRIHGLAFPLALLLSRSMQPESVKLSREVLPPQKPQSGLGVMLVAAAAMFFAVASSAFILRARMVQNCCPLQQVQAPVAVDWNARIDRGPADCGMPVFKAPQADGTVAVVYEKCPEPAPTGELQHFVIVNAPDAPAPIEGGVEVHAVEP